MKPTSLPRTMRALVLTDYDGRPESLGLTERPLPRPGPAQVLVRVAAAPINPSDLMFVRGMYGLRRTLPCVPGFEASGTVVGVGRGVGARLMMGRRVACVAGRSDGPWAEYMIAPVAQCIPLPERISDEQGATLVVNPLTAWALVDRARREKHRAIAQTAAASALGRMLLKLAQREGIPLVNVVRRPEQVATLGEAGAEHVLDSSEPDFPRRLKERFHALGVTLAFDAVGGKLTGQLLQAMPPGGCVSVYGGLAQEDCRVRVSDLIFERKRVDGFWLSDWFARPARERLRARSALMRLFGRELETPVRARVALEDVHSALALAQENMTAGKVLFVPSLRGA